MINMKENLDLENYLFKLEQAVKFGHKEYIEELLENNIHPRDISEWLNEQDNDQLKNFLTLITDETIASIVDVAEEDLQVRMIVFLKDKQLPAVFEHLPNDEIANILGVLPIDKKKQILKMMKSDEYRIIQKLLGYEEDSAGGIMTTEYIALNDTFTCRRAIDKIKQIAPKTEVIETIFIINKSKKLMGLVDLRDILVSNDDTLLSDIMVENHISVHHSMDQEEVALLVSKYDLNVIPVVNSFDSILGIITVDDILDVIVEEQTEDMQRLSGVKGEAKIDDSVGKSIRFRIPWLIVNLFTALLASSVVAAFDSTTSQVVALIAIMPIVAGMGGNAGQQTLSMTIRGIALGELNLRENWLYVFKEMIVGIINGVIIGIITGIFLYIIYGDIYLILIVFLALIGNLFIAGIFGFLVPLVLKKIGIDPALVSSIFLTTATDTLGFLIFLALATIFIDYLV